MLGFVKDDMISIAFILFERFEFMIGLYALI